MELTKILEIDGRTYESQRVIFKIIDGVKYKISNFECKVVLPETEHTNEIVLATFSKVYVLEKEAKHLFSTLVFVDSETHKIYKDFITPLYRIGKHYL